MKKIGKRIQAGFSAVIVAAMLLSPAIVYGGDEPDVVVLLTEVVESGVTDEEQHLSFWWSQADSPAWTGSDEVLFEALRQAGVSPAQPSQIDISRIYRRPGLSTHNAAQLGALLDGERVLVGEIQYRPLKPIAPLGYQGVEARAELELVPAGDTDGVSLDRFTVTRQVFGNSTDELLAKARQAAGAALGEVMGQSLRRASGEVGTRSNENLLALRNVERAENLEAIRDRLLEIEEVDTVKERWASEGVIALEVEAAGDQNLDYVYGVLENHEFDEFYMMRSSEAAFGGAKEYWLEPREAGF